MSRMIARDPFARTELHRENMSVGATTSCSWCGGGKMTQGGHRLLYRYFTESDGGRTYNHPGLFCGVGCFRSYHGD